MTGKVALVTGASRGIGRAIAIAFADAGVPVAINFHSREAEAREVQREVTSRGVRATICQADVSVSSEVSRLVAHVEQELGPIEILVNNAGIARPQKIENTGEADWNEILSVNLTSSFLVTQAVLPGMRARRWGRVINVSSVAAQTGGVVGVHYAASKAGMLGMMRFYAKHLAAEGITFNAIAPALIETDMTALNPSATAAHIPVGRLGTADEVAQIAVMLANNAYITGQTINANGGWYMN